MEKRKVETDMSWYQYRVWIWRGTTVKLEAGDALGLDDDAVQNLLREDVFEGESIAECVISYKGTVAEYERHLEEQEAIFNRMGVQ